MPAPDASRSAGLSRTTDDSGEIPAPATVRAGSWLTYVNELNEKRVPRQSNRWLRACCPGCGEYRLGQETSPALTDSAKQSMARATKVLP